MPSRPPAPGKSRRTRGVRWNFAARTRQEIAQAREDVTGGTRSGEVKGYDGDPLRAPALPETPLKPRGRGR